MKINIYILRDMTLERVGYIEASAFNAERCFDVCNWSAHKKSKPEELHADISEAGKGICFENPKDGRLWLAKSIGWLSGDIDSILNYARENQNNKLWL